LLSLSQRAAQARHYAAVERRLFEVLGGWVPTTPEPEVKLLLRAHSFRHAWHAELWEDLLPAGTVAPEPDEALAAVLETTAAAKETLERLMGVYRVVLPALVAAYGECREAASPVSDGPLLRALGLMLVDDAEALSAGEALVAGVEGDEQGAKRAAAHARDVQELVAAARGMEYTEMESQDPEHHQASSDP
jgi:hypothetical protein